jgi:hypothetical protein
MVTLGGQVLGRENVLLSFPPGRHVYGNYIDPVKEVPAGHSLTCHVRAMCTGWEEVPGNGSPAFPLKEAAWN